MSLHPAPLRRPAHGRQAQPDPGRVVSQPTRPDHPHRTSLDDVARSLGLPPVEAGADLLGVTLDSRRVRPGDLYAALPGSRAHGASFSAQAAADGAVAVLTDAAGEGDARASGLPVLVVERPRAVLGEVAALVYGHPAASLRTIGVTGTQGKTTVTRLLDGGLLAAGVRSAVVGTVGTRIAGEEVRTALTTPEAPDLHGLFARMRELDVTACAMEVSSHALVMGRVDGVRFDVAVFTNLGRDHLDFHADVEDYFQAKAMLFTPEHAALGLVCTDDEHGRRLAAEAPIPVRTYGLTGPADWTATDVALGADGSRFTVLGPDGVRVSAAVPLPGDFNVANALAAIAAAAEAGYDPQAVADGIAASGGVPGRLERVPTGRDLTVVVDYAHKPDAVEAVLRTLRPVTRGRLVIVIGAGGDRDTGKRPVMGEIAARLADLVVVTDDNPRSEDPAAIRAEVLAGTRGGPAEVVEIGDRRAAIAAAIDGAGPGDVVVVAGKGHESGQEIAGVVHPFDDREVVREVLAR
ncbi:UDP-N-acetylmuramoyl-L-alanyl-D-glutamate--2,6-diaminopimelate ligase [Nocardioides sp. W3-2-3]|uniref:UDP-N-acetylmuramoyl-L-alanyl-D-glutamate--2, 6-diaminopimelate ligase n=1 Tax=Nocardioides convexus TaxID=2712224 RepID=UPI00241882D7|nr:UDP-N-acetylmuramoyl-L-alanyl-D-glutamate--2,6-diaminopimelate ligase [Nocardioides convexus]NGZ99989.1 UDP-N-acetylmuramoyl-L-alanyl-D-glutamate--2,6-diaminopimelate ligase [Nocardioides convexus]